MTGEGDSAANAIARAPRARTLLVAALSVGMVAWFGAWNGDYVFDDVPAIRDNPRMQAGDWWGAAYEHASPLANRPLATLSLVLDAKAWRDAARGQHVTNVLLHLVAIALVFAVVRGALRTKELAARFDLARANWIAFLSASLFAAHPLGADAVAYATQRSTLLLAVASLAAFWATMRAESSPRPRTWRALAVVATTLAMLAKEDAVVLPLLLAGFVRAFLCLDGKELRRFGPFLCGIASTWLVLFATVAFGPHNPTVGYATNPPCTAIEWLQTQAFVVVHYLRLVVAPFGLRGCYDWSIERTLAAALLPGALVLALFAATTWACVRRPRAGFLGAWVFLWLAPTSTVLPIVTELVAERRMYLPLVALVVPIAIGLERATASSAWRRLRCALPLLLLGGLVLFARQRVAVYRDEAAFWADAHAKHDPASRTFVASILLNNQARIAREHGDLGSARSLFEQAAACEAAPATVRLHFATLLFELGDEAAAAPVLMSLAREVPDLADELHRRAQAVFEAALRGPRSEFADSLDPRVEGAVVLARMAVAVSPDRAPLQNTLGTLFATAGRLAEAEAAYRRALALDPGAEAIYRNLGELLLRARRAREAVPVLQQLLARRPRDLELRVQVATAFLQAREVGFARIVVDEAARLQPEHGQVLALRRELDALERR